MKTYISATLLILMVGAWTNSAFAVVDFESTPLGGTPTNDGPVIGPYTDSGVQISFGFDSDNNGSVEADAIFELFSTDGSEGTNIGFQGSNGTDTADLGFASQLGRWFLRSPTPGMNFGRFVIQYSSPFPVTAASGEIWDIDGQLPDGTFTERYKVEAFDSANTSLGVIFSPIGTLTSTIAPLDGRPWVFSFSGILGDIDRIDITFVGTKPMGIGLAFNNFYPTTAVPEPTMLTLAAFGGFLLMAMRRRRTAPSTRS